VFLEVPTDVSEEPLALKAALLRNPEVKSVGAHDLRRGLLRGGGLSGHYPALHLVNVLRVSFVSVSARGQEAAPVDPTNVLFWSPRR
jgi:hypothetical protein